MDSNTSSASATSLPGLLTGYAGVGAKDAEKRRFKCSICPFATQHKSSLQTHMKTHSNDRPWKCDVCQKTFKLKHHLKHHRVTHTFNKPSFKCSVCSYRSNSSFSLLLHKTEKHGETVPQVNMHRTLNPRKNPPYLVPQNRWDEGSSPNEVFTSPLPSFSFLSSSSNRGILNTAVDRQQNVPDMTPTITSISCFSGPNIPPVPMLSPTSNQSEGNVPSTSDSQENSPTFTHIKDEFKKKKRGQVEINLVEDVPEIQETPDNNVGDPLKTPTELSDASLPCSSTSFNQQSISRSPSVEITRPDILESHTDTVTSVASMADNWKCDPCGIIFPDNIMYGLHTACHSVMEPYKCNICGKMCRDKYDFTFHITMGKH